MGISALEIERGLGFDLAGQVGQRGFSGIAFGDAGGELAAEDVVAGGGYQAAGKDCGPCGVVLQGHDRRNADLFAGRLGIAGDI